MNITCMYCDNIISGTSETCSGCGAIVAKKQTGAPPPPPTGNSSALEAWLVGNSSYFTAQHLPVIRAKFATLPPQYLNNLQSLKFHDPDGITVASVFLGAYGVDRFLLGDHGLGIAKILTFGGCLVWWFVDLFLVGKRARELNFEKLMQVIGA